MLYLLDGSEFKSIEAQKSHFDPNNNWISVESDKIYYADFNLNNIIVNKLKLASQTNQLVHTQWLRGIGKTHELISFAKQHGYGVIEPSMVGAGLIKIRENYQEIYDSDINSLRRGCKPNGDLYIKDIVVDEGVTNIQEIKDAGFNIITGFYTPKQEDNALSFKEKVMKTLVDEIDALTPKLQATRENKDYGTYKNLINAYREILNLIQNHAKIYGM